MPSDSLTQFYRRLIEGQAPIHEDLQPRLLEHLFALREFGLVGTFARRADVSPASDARIAARSEASVIAGWASRPGRSREELSARLGKEKRATVLLPLAKMTDLPADLYRQVAVSSSSKVAEALLENPSVPHDVKLAKIADVVVSLDKKGEWRQREFIEKAFRHDRELLEALLHHTNDPAMAAVCLREIGDVTSSVIESVIVRLDALLVVEHSYYSPGPALCTALAEQELTGSQLQKLRSAVKKAHEREKSSNRYSSADYSTPKFLLSEKGLELTKKCRELAASEDVAASSALFKDLCRQMKKHDIEDRVLQAAALNKVLPPDQIVPFMNQMHGNTETLLARNWLRRKDYASLATMAVDSFWCPSWVAECADIGELLAAVVEYVRSKDEALPEWVLTHEYVLATPEASVMFLPWKQLHRIDANAGNVFHIEDAQTLEGLAKARAKVDAVVTVAQQMIVDRLGDEKTFWETFNTLAGEFEGTLPELLDVVVAVSA
jgi:hypothetical protein